MGPVSDYASSEHEHEQGDDDAEYAYGKQSVPDTAHLATKYRDLREDVSVELLVDEEDREIPRFPDLSAAGLLAYPDDFSGETFDDLDDDRIPSEVQETDVRLLQALVDFHTRFHGWRMFAEEHLDITLDELLDIAAPERKGDVGVMHGAAKITENLCESTLALNREYLEAYPALPEE